MAPIFSKLLTRSDITSKKLTLQTRVLQHFLPLIGDNSIKLQVLDCVGQVWRFNFYVRPNALTDAKRKPVLTAGWGAFVKAKGLREKDEVIFSFDQELDGGLHYKILVLRRPISFCLGKEAIVRDATKLMIPFTIPNNPANTQTIDLFK